jgi:LysR family transcriptional regulator, glycine cleavage system transcriptional activator
MSHAHLTLQMDRACIIRKPITSAVQMIAGLVSWERGCIATEHREANDFMSGMPSLALLQTIEAVTRLGSFKRAAEEQCVTSSAISHRVRQVEEHFGKHLFEREGQGVRPTKEAIQIADSVAAAQSSIYSVWRAASATSDGKRVRVCCMAAFAERFILSNLDDFKRKFPHFHVESTSVTYGEGGMRQEYDILIGIGPRPSDDWECQKIQELTVRPIVSKKHASAAFKDNMLFGPLLETTNSVLPWQAAARHLGFPIHPAAKTVSFDSILSACSAAEHGVGVTLAPTWVAASYVANGTVIALGDAPIPTDYHYWLATKKGRKLATVHERFERWLLARVAESDDSLP